MKFKKAFALAAILPLLPLASCSIEDSSVISYYLEADTTNAKLDYYVGELFNPEGLIINIVTLTDGVATAVKETTDYEFTFDIKKELTLQDKEIQVVSNQQDVLPTSFSINVTIPTFGIGEQQNFKELYPGYTFTSDDPFVARVRPDGYLETYREGNFSIAGTKKGEKGIYIDGVVKIKEEYQGDNFSAPSAISSGIINDIAVFPTLATDRRYLLKPGLSNDPKAEFTCEVTNKEVASIIIDKEFGSLYLKTSNKPGESRLKIYNKKDNSIIYDYYFCVSTPYSEYELASLLAGTHWVSPSITGDHFNIKFSDATTAVFGGFKGYQAIQQFDFTFELDSSNPVEIIHGVPHVNFKCNGTNGIDSVTYMRMNQNANDIKLYDRNGIISFFQLSL